MRARYARTLCCTLRIKYTERADLSLARPAAPLSSIGVGLLHGRREPLEHHSNNDVEGDDTHKSLEGEKDEDNIILVPRRQVHSPVVGSVRHSKQALGQLDSHDAEYAHDDEEEKKGVANQAD